MIEQGRSSVRRWGLLTAGALQLAACADARTVAVRGEVAGVAFDELSHGNAESRPPGTSGRNLVLRTYAASCNEPHETDEPLLYVQLDFGKDGPPEVPPGSYAVGTQFVDDTRLRVSALAGTNGSDSVPAETGTITIEASSGERYAGSFEFIWARGDRLSGEFDIPTCQRP